MVMTPEPPDDLPISPDPAPEKALLALISAASQHRPRPLPLFLDLLRRETAGDPHRLARMLAGLRRYQQAERPAPPPPAPVVARAGRALLRDYGTGGPGPALLFVPSLINPPSVLDLGPGRSLLRWLAGEGFRPLLVDWGGPTPADAGQDLAAHVESMLLPLIDALDRPLVLIGYCLGGTMAIAAAARRPVAALALIAAPWSFAGYPAPARRALAGLWDHAAPVATQMGLLPMEALQTAFWQLDPARIAARFESFATQADIADLVRLEDWANDGPPIALAAARDLFEGCYRDDRPGTGHWSVAGGRVDPAAIACPILDILSTTDRIVPAATALSTVLPQARTHRIALGHVGMVVGGRAQDHLWQPLRDWLSSLPRG
jgi:polyhydroxyalkanoate synthase